MNFQRAIPRKGDQNLRVDPYRVAALLVTLSLTGCGTRSLDLQEFIDRRVNEVWMKPGQYVDAAEFFSNGGHYYNHPDDATAIQLDEAHIIPLLAQIREKFELDQFVILDGTAPQTAWAVVTRLPQNPRRVQELEAWLKAADSEFPGMILQEWGHEWLSLDFLNEEEAAVAREAWGEE